MNQAILRTGWDMSKTAKYQKKASADFVTRKKESGWIRISMWIRPEWKQVILDYIKGLK